MGSLKTIVRLENGSKVTAFLDTSVKINVMTRERIEDMGWAMQYSLKLELISYIGHNHSFLGFCEDIEVFLRVFKTRYSIFILKIGDHNLMLEQLFLNSVKFSQKYKPDGIFGTITYFYMQQLAVF